MRIIENHMLRGRLKKRPERSRHLLDEIREESERYTRPSRNLAFWTMCVYRFGRWVQDRPSEVGRQMGSKVYGGMFFAIELFTANEVNREAQIGDGFTLLHSGSVRIHPDTVIGKNVTIMHEVTLGTNVNETRTDMGAPVIEDDVFIGAGAKILGPIRIGRGAVVAANSLVLNDVPPGATAVGVPARILRYNGRSAGPGPNEPRLAS